VPLACMHGSCQFTTTRALLITLTSKARTLSLPALIFTHKHTLPVDQARCKEAVGGGPKVMGGHVLSHSHTYTLAHSHALYVNLGHKKAAGGRPTNIDRCTHTPPPPHTHIRIHTPIAQSHALPVFVFKPRTQGGIRWAPLLRVL